MRLNSVKLFSVKIVDLLQIVYYIITLIVNFVQVLLSHTVFILFLVKTM